MIYPDFIQALPEADIPIPGVWSRLLAGADGQAVFFRLPEGLVIPHHSHGAQWGFVAKGRIELTIGGQTKVYGPGDAYAIGDGVVHHARCLEETFAVDVFADPLRYRPKKS